MYRSQIGAWCFCAASLVMVVKLPSVEDVLIIILQNCKRYGYYADTPLICDGRGILEEGLPVSNTTSNDLGTHTHTHTHLVRGHQRTHLYKRETDRSSYSAGKNTVSIYNVP